MSQVTGGPRGSNKDEVGGSMGIVGALEQVGGYEGVSGCIGGVKCKLIPIPTLGYEDGMGEGTSGSGDASTMGGDASGMGGWTSG